MSTVHMLRHNCEICDTDLQRRDVEEKFNQQLHAGVQNCDLGMLKTQCCLGSICLQTCDGLQQVVCKKRAGVFHDHDCAMVISFARVSHVDLCAGCRFRTKFRRVNCW